MTSVPTPSEACSIDDSGCPACGVVRGIATFFRIALGALFIFSGVVKLSDPLAFAFAIKGFKLVDNHALISQATFSIPWTEVLIGVLMILGLYTRIATGAFLTMMVIFIGAVVAVIVRDIDTSCGCFGKYLGSKIDETTVLRNVVLLALGILVYIYRGGFLTLDSWRRNRQSVQGS